MAPVWPAFGLHPIPDSSDRLLSAPCYTRSYPIEVSSVPADDRLADGLTWTELRTALSVALASDKAVGLEITVYNPRFDEDGSAGRGLTTVLVDALGLNA